MLTKDQKYYIFSNAGSGLQPEPNRSGSINMIEPTGVMIEIDSYIVFLDFWIILI